jgi:hypothetical protein
MNFEKELEFVKKYCPNIYFDKNEPFFPIRIGYTIFESSGKSPSFNREIKFFNEAVKYAIEYAIYWDYDIEHLYDLEHVWVYINEEGGVIDGEASFHGKYFKALLEDRSNIEEGTHMKVYCQPGKHAFSPMIELFKLIPDLMLATYENAGKDGLIVTNVGRGRYDTSEKINNSVRKYLQLHKFHPSMEFISHTISEDIFVPWEDLHNEIPDLVNKELEHIYSVVGE